MEEGPREGSCGAPEEGGSGNDSDDEYIVDQLMREKGKELEKEDSGDVDGVGSPSSKAKAVPLSAYEQLRQKNVVRNAKKLQELGLAGAKKGQKRKKGARKSFWRAKICT